MRETGEELLPRNEEWADLLYLWTMILLALPGRVLFPAAGYQYIVWETFANIHEVQLNTSRVSLRNCKFLRATSIPEKDSVNLTVSIFKGSGEFEVMEGNSTVVTGIIKFLPNNKVDVWNFTSSDFTQSHGARLNKNEVYRELSIQGYRYR